MSLHGQIIDGALRALAYFHPDAAPLVSMAVKYEPQLERAAPVILAAAKEGPSAFEAAKAEAPKLAKAIEDFVASSGAAAPEVASEGAQAVSHSSYDKHVENVTRVLVGANEMTPAEETAWINRATPVMDDSRVGSA
jgi:hypothetical protein